MKRLEIMQRRNPAADKQKAKATDAKDRTVREAASVHQHDPEKKTMQAVAGSGGVLAASSAQQGQLAISWAHNVWADMLA